MEVKLFCSVLTFSMIFMSIFVEPSETRHKRKVITHKSYVPLYPYECDDKFRICNQTLNYPKKKIANYLRRHPILRDNVRIRTSDNIASRQFDEEDGINMCDTSIAYSIPEAIQGEDGKMMFVVNNVLNYTQTIEYDKCSTRSGCMFSSHFPNDYETSCKQHKISLKLLSLDAKGVFKMRSFWIPGGCACVYKLQKKK